MSTPVTGSPRPAQSPWKPVGLGPAAASPDLADLTSRLHFSPEEGRIWLDDQRMVLIHASALGVLRREVIENVGLERARGLLTRMGYNSGANDAELARRLRPDANLQDMFAVGPQLHAIEGIVHVEQVRLDLDVERGRYYGEFIWHGSTEDEEHLRAYGIGAEPACWMQIGYASGYTSVFMGRPILFREVECSSMGHAQCRIVGRPVEEWQEADRDRNYLRAEPFTQGLSVSSSLGGLKQQTPGSAMGVPDLVGVSTAFNAVCHLLQRVSDTTATVLFLGESGVGKEVLARTLHRIGPRQNKPFVAINCAAIPENLVESELFGVRRGAFTGATQSRAGRFERADGGTLFLDEIGILPLSAQGKLLRALQEGEIERVGDERTQRVDVRVIAATNLDLRREVAEGRFREDLFFRLNVFPIRIPALRERRQDIPVFMQHFMRKACERHGRQVTGFTGRAIDALLSYRWPGNVRELENMIERGVILAPKGGVVDVHHLFIGGEDLQPSGLRLDRSGGLCEAGGASAQPAPGEAAASSLTRRIDRLLLDDGEDAGDDGVSLDEIETALLQRALERSGGNMSAAARLLGLTRPQLVYRIKSRGLQA